MTPEQDAVRARLEECAEHLLCNALNLEQDFKPIDPNADLYRKVVADQKQWSADLRALLSCLDAQDRRWRPIKSEKPPRRAEVLLIGQYPGQSGWTDVYHGWAEDHRWARWPHYFEPTHWQPLPAPPSEQDR